ncbi:MAG: hypothetical protein F7C08_03395 [Desulfurococcales archaeon]|nr:hypothetical protein [Desulfurococcales archaeon]MCE4605558.1 hypothetical protein [Desulfurococcales archaeon]
MPPAPTPPTHIIITTSRRPSPRTRSLVKDLAGVIPGATRLTRGHLTYQELSIEAATLGADRVVVVGEKRGNPSIMRIYEPIPPKGLNNIVTLIIKGVKLAREAGVPSRARARFLRVEHDGSEDSMEVAEALVRGLHARLTPVEPSVVARLESRGYREVLLTFTSNGLSVGPVLRIGIPWRMIKG